MRPPVGANGSVAAGAPVVPTVEPSRSPLRLRSNPVRLVSDAWTIARASRPSSDPLVASRSGTSWPSVTTAGCSSSEMRGVVAAVGAEVPGAADAAAGAMHSATSRPEMIARATRFTAIGP